MFAKAGPVFLNPIPSTGTKGGVLCSSRKNNAFICFAALNARCAAEQTQTVTREAPTITVLPGKEKSPQLDDGDSGFPPRDDGDGGGGGGGGGGNWSGGFFFFGFLAFLGFLKDKESEGPYQNDRPAKLGSDRRTAVDGKSESPSTSEALDLRFRRLRYNKRSTIECLIYSLIHI